MNLKQRFFAMAVHSLFSLVLLSIALFFVFHLWYPTSLAKAMGVTHIFWIILGIDLILGPLLTFAVFNPQKKELKYDLLIIVLIQLTAYIYGLHTVAQGRPVFQVFVVDDIELVRAIDIVDIEKADDIYRTSILKKPQWVSAVYSTDPKIAEQQKQDEMFGSSLACHPETYQPISKHTAKIEAKLRPLTDLKKFNKSEVIQKNIALYQKQNIAGYLPVKGFEEDMTALFDYVGRPIKIIDLRPW